MKQTILALLLFLTVSTAYPQNWKNLKDLKKYVKKSPTDISQVDATAALKEALSNGTVKGTDLVSQVDGYYKNPDIVIPLPPEAKNVEKTLRRIGAGQKVDDAILSMNRAAERAAIEAKPIFLDAITGITFSDAVGIVRGGNTSGTDYLKRSTNSKLNNKFQPIIKSSLDEVDATRYWKDVIQTYNKVPFVKKINTDLAAYVTQKAIDGLFTMIGKEEIAIREDPAARTSDLLVKVFGKK